MNRLQGITDADEYLVTLNPRGRVDPSRSCGADVPTSTRSTPARRSRPQRGCASAGGDRLAFAGAYHGWGFHEDGCRSGVEAAEPSG